MKYFAAIAAFAGAAYAQDQCLASAAAIPPCALGYLVSAASAVAQCSLVDFGCQCSNSQQIQNEVVQTVLTACGAQTGASVLQAVSSLCGCVSANPGTVSLNAVQSACQASAAAIPPCALGYLASAGGAIGQCAVDDFACQCQNSVAIEGSIAGPVASQCTGSVGIQDVINSADALCSCVSANGGGSGGGSDTGSSGPTTTGSGTAPTGSGGDTTAAPTPTGGSGGAGTSPSSSFSRFTGGAASAIPAVGGIFGAVIGLLAYL